MTKDTAMMRLIETVGHLEPREQICVLLATAAFYDLPIVEGEGEGNDED